MHYFGELELAVHGKAETLQNIPFEEITEAALEARQKAWNYPGDVEHNLEEFLHKMKSEVKRVLQDPSEDGIEVFYLQTEFDGAPIEMDCLELLMRRYPELEAAVVANVEFDTADPSGTEWFTFYSPAGSEQLSGSLPLTGLGSRCGPAISLSAPWTGRFMRSRSRNWLNCWPRATRSTARTMTRKSLRTIRLNWPTPPISPVSL